MEKEDENNVEIAKGKLIIYSLKKISDTHEIKVKQLDGLYIYRTNSSRSDDYDYGNTEEKLLHSELNFSAEPFTIEYISECPFNQLPLYLLSNIRYQIAIDPENDETKEWFSKRFCNKKINTKTRNCVVVKVMSEKINLLSPQPPMAMAIQGVLQDDGHTLDLQMIPFYSCMELTNITEMQNQYEEVLSQIQPLYALPHHQQQQQQQQQHHKKSLLSKRLKENAQTIYNLFTELQMIPGQKLCRSFSTSFTEEGEEEEEEGDYDDATKMATSSHPLDNDFDFDSPLKLNPASEAKVVQSLNKKAKNLMAKNTKKDTPIQNEPNMCLEYRYLQLKKLLEVSNKSVVENKLKKDQVENLEPHFINSFKSNIQRCSSPAPSDTSTNSSLSIFSLQKKKKDHGLRKTSQSILARKHEKYGNTLAEQNKMKLWHLTKNAVSKTMKIDPSDQKFKNWRTKVYRSCIFALKEKINKEKVSEEKLSQIVEYQVNLFAMI